MAAVPSAGRGGPHRRRSLSLQRDGGAGRCAPPRGWRGAGHVGVAGRCGGAAGTGRPRDGELDRDRDGERGSALGHRPAGLQLRPGAAQGRCRSAPGGHLRAGRCQRAGQGVRRDRGCQRRRGERLRRGCGASASSARGAAPGPGIPSVGAGGGSAGPGPGVS